jgi:polyhydroxyalkanoate synthesis regulator phasin
MTTTSNNGGSPLLVQLTISRFGNTRKGDLAEIKTDADKAMLSLSKHLLDCEELCMLQRYDTEMGNFMRRRSVPSMFKSGIYQLRPEYAEKLNAQLTLMAERRQVLVDALVSVYETRKEEARQRLGAQFSEENYPSRERFQRDFSVTWRFFTLSAPEKVQGLSADFIEREAARLSSMFDDVKANATAILRAEMQGLVDHLLDRLTPNEDGKRKRLSKSAVTNIAEFLDTFQMRNVANDADLEALLKKTNLILSGIDVDLIRDGTVSLDDARKPFEELKKKIDVLVEAAPRRLIDVDALSDLN